MNELVTYVTDKVAHLNNGANKSWCGKDSFFIFSKDIWDTIKNKCLECERCSLMEKETIAEKIIKGNIETYNITSGGDTKYILMQMLREYLEELSKEGF